MQRKPFATMASSFMFWISFALFSSSYGQFCTSKDNCRQLEFKPAHTLDGKRLKDHVISTPDVMDGDFCETLCYMEPNCVSYNLKKTPRKNGKFVCELSNSTFEGQKDQLEINSGYIYRGTKNACLKKSCKNNATCQTGFTDKGFRCLCTTGFTGSLCETDINECATGTHKCSVVAVCSNTDGSYNCTCKPGYYGDGLDCEPVSTCKDLYNKNMSQGNKAYLLQMPSGKVPVYCHMTGTELGACGGGGWTLVMKIDGNKRTFHFNSKLWGNKTDFNLTGGKTLFDNYETKLPTYWNTSFSKICLGMKRIGHPTRFIVLTKNASSLYSLIADDKYRATTLGRDKWKWLIGPFASLQSNCSKEGFNIDPGYHTFPPKARIGILGNEQNDCNTPDSRIGFGTGGNRDDSNTCGNKATAEYGADNGDKNIKAMGYILVQ